MKKIIIFLGIVLIIVASVGYMYLNYQATYREAQKINAQYEWYKDKEILGTDLATLINRAVDDNTKNDIKKENTGLYEDNGKDSVRIDILFTDDNEVHSMEEIYNSGTDTFMQYYNQIKFKCTKMEYHQNNGRVSYLYFEQIAT